jgi:hypothetical protein
MGRVPRAQYLCSKVEAIIDPEYFLRNPYLVSCLVDLNRLPIECLTDLAPFSKLTATAAEVVRACKNSPRLTIVTDRGSPCILMPYRVNASALIIRKGYQFGTVFEIGDFVRVLIGGIRHCVYRTADSDDFAINFADSKECMAVWRALESLPFKGRILDVCIYSPQNPRCPPAPIIISPIPVMVNHAAWKAAVQGKTEAVTVDIKNRETDKKRSVRLVGK